MYFTIIINIKLLKYCKNMFKSPMISFEFFPPKDNISADNLRIVQTKLAQIKPEYFSITFGAGGGTQKKTVDTIMDINNNYDIPACPHISCIGSSKITINNLLTIYKKHNINKLVVLRGDTPTKMITNGDFSYAYQLVEFIRDNFGSYFDIKVAAYPEKHPQSSNIYEDIKYFIYKVKAGANSAITQYFYNTDAYFNFCDEVSKQVDIEVVPGIMPITNCVQLNRFSQLSGAEIPRWILNKLTYYKDDLQSLRAFGYEVVAGMCYKLKSQGVDNFHFYSMNKAEPSYSLANNLKNT